MARNEELVTPYNEALKERYLTYRESQNLQIRRAMRPIFTYTKPFEERWEKDCSCFTRAEIGEMYSTLIAHSWASLIQMTSQLAIYTTWCMSQNLVTDNQNHYSELSKEDLKQYISSALKDSLVLSRKDLEEIIKDFPNVSDQFLAIAIFEGWGGLEFSDFYQMSMDNFDFKENILTSNGRTMETSSLLRDLAEASSEEYDKYSHEGMLKRGYKKDDVSIIKDASNAGESSIARNQRKIYMRLYALEEEYGKALGYNALRNSGRIDLVNKFLKEDKSNNVKKTYILHQEAINTRYGDLGTRLYLWLDENAKYFSTEN